MEPEQQPAEDAVVTVKLVTKLAPEFRVPETPIAVPANLTRYGLSQIVNHLLALDPARPFDFLVDGELLRLNLQRHLESKQLSVESVLEIEYVPAVLPPTPKEEHPHEDWVSAVAALPSSSSSGGGSLDADGSFLIASGCYDGIVRLWSSGSGEALCSWAAHKGPVQAAVAVASHAGEGLLLTAGNDNVARLWRGVAAAAAGGDAPEAAALLKGHSDTIQDAAVSPDGNLCATASWDGRLLMWRCGDSLLAAAEAGEEDGEGGKVAGSKKRKVGSNGVAAAQHEEAPRSELSGHSQCVSGVSWPAAGTLASASWDHSVRLWDVATGASRETLNHNKAVYCLAAAPGGEGLVAFGGAEKALRVWDPRVRSGEGLAVRSCTSHTDWISAVAWHPTSAHHVVTASHDSTAKLWDLRAAIPLHTLQGGTDKLLCAAWVGPETVATGGADCKLRTAHAAVSGIGGR